MGGCGSGRDSDHDAVELCSELSISWMLQQGWLERSGTQSISWQNSFGGHLDNLTVRVSKSESSLSFYLLESGQTIGAESEPMRFGGVRWWLICPDCHRRCIALYRAPGQRSYSCRVCLDLTYLSCQYSGSLAARVKNSEEIIRWRRLTEPPKEWVRKRDRRPGYRSRARRFYDYIQSIRAMGPN